MNLSQSIFRVFVEERPAVWTNRALEVLWLLIVVLVPLAFLDREYVLSEVELAYVDVPKTALLRTLVGLMACIWLVQWAFSSPGPGNTAFSGRKFLRHPSLWLSELGGWLRGQPSRWVTLAVILYLFSTLLSTVFSVSFNVSMWGLVPGQDTYPAYTIICYVLLFGIISTHLKTRAQLGRLLGAIVFMGVLVGAYSVSQHYGYDFLNLLEAPGTSRSSSTLGNAILAGSVMLMTIPISLAAATVTLRDPINTRRFWGKVALWVLVLTVQLLGILFTSARGPWIGAIAAVAGFFALVAVFVGWRSLVRATLILGPALALSAGIILGPPQLGNGEEKGRSGVEEPTPAASGVAGVQEPAEALDLAFSFPRSEASDVVNRLTSVSRGVERGGLSGRFEIWQASQRLMLGRPWFKFDNLSFSIARPIFGYGPDTFKYAYLLERRPRGDAKVLIAERFAHNYFIHKGVELGFLGLLTALGIFVALFLVGAYQLLWKRGHIPDLQTLVLVGVLAAIAGRLLEQMPGVAAISDLTLSWVLLAVFVALPATARETQEPQPSDSQLAVGLRAPRLGSPAVIFRDKGRNAGRLALVFCLIAGIGILTWVKTINYPRAAVNARAGVEFLGEGDLDRAMLSLGRAVDLAPDVAVYHHLEGLAYSSYIGSPAALPVSECGLPGDTVAYERCLAKRVYSSNLQAAEQRPLEWRSRVILGDSILKLVATDRDAALVREAIQVHEEAVELDPKSWSRRAGLAAVYIQVGQPELALETLEESLELLHGPSRTAYFLLFQGMAYLDLSRPGAALNSLNESLRLAPGAFAHTNRGAAYNALGRYFQAIQDLDEAIKLNPRLAMAYNNRGNAYGNLEQFDMAVKDFGSAVALDPRFGLAYKNRALAYTYLGKDSNAQGDIRRAGELGIDVESLRLMIENAKRVR